MIYVIATIITLPGKSAELIRGARNCIDQTRKEDGCISYSYVQDTEDANTVIVVERWTTREALAMHLLADHLKTWREARRPLVQSTKVEIIHAGRVETL